MAAHALLLCFDGAASPNPGKAGCGAVLFVDGDEVWRACESIEQDTSNGAECE